MILFTIIMCSTIIFSKLDFSNTKSSNLKKRKEQSKDVLGENSLRKKTYEYIENKTTATKKYKTETLCLQAGMNTSYPEFVIMSIISAILSAVIIGVIMKNPFLAIMFLFMGYNIPKQVITIIKNKRVEKLDSQVGSFMNMSIERYKNTKDMAKSLQLTLTEFKGQEPMYTELKKTVSDINVGKPVGEALDGLARRTGNKFVQRFADYYKIVADVGTEEIRNSLLPQAFMQYEENRANKLLLKKEISGPKKDAYMLLACIPGFALYQVAVNKDYLPFMTGTLFGQVGTACICLVFILALWFINAKIGAPIE